MLRVSGLLPFPFTPITDFCRYSKTCVKGPLSKRPKIGFQDQLSVNAGQKYCRIKLPFVIKIFVLPCFNVRFTQVLLYFPFQKDPFFFQKTASAQDILVLMAQVTSKGSDELAQDILVLMAQVTSKGSDEPAHPCLPERSLLAHTM